MEDMQEYRKKPSDIIDGPNLMRVLQEIEKEQEAAHEMILKIKSQLHFIDGEFDLGEGISGIMQERSKEEKGTEPTLMYRLMEIGGKISVAKAKLNRISNHLNDKIG